MEGRKHLFCNQIKRKLITMYSRVDILSGLMEMGFSMAEAEHYLNTIDEVKKGSTRQVVGDDDGG